MAIAMLQGLGFGPLGERPALKRLAWLKLRTLLVAALALAALAASAFLLVPPLQSIFSALYALFTPGDSAQALHLPPELLHNPRYERLQAVLIFTVLMAVAGLSAGAFGRTRAALVAVVPLLLAGLTLWSLPPTSRWMHVVPSQLERRIAQADWQAALALVMATQGPQLVKDYVLAQIGLREHDQARLILHAVPVLAWTQRYVYALPMSAADLAVQPYAVNFEPEVLWALDVGLHQQAETEIGIGWQTTPAPDKSLQSALQTLMRGLQLALGTALLAGACALTRLWDSMRRRVARIHLELHPAADAFTGLKLQPVADSPGVAAPAPSPLPKRRRQSRMTAGLSVPVPTMFYASGVIGFSRANKPAGASSGAKEASASNSPCEFAGSWTSARAESGYKVTLGEDGQHVAKPIASGAYSEASLRGTWRVDNRQMRRNSASRSAGPADTHE